MNSGRVPDLRHAHLAKHLDGKGPGAVLRHGHIGWQNRELPWMMHLLAALSSNTDDLLGKSQGIVIQDILAQWDSRNAGKPEPLLKVNPIDIVERFEQRGEP